MFINPDNYLSLIEAVKSYFEFRSLKDPDYEGALRFLNTETGELLNAITKLEPDWVRNNPLGTEAANQAVADELGDCLMMLLKSYEKATELDICFSVDELIDPVFQELEKMTYFSSNKTVELYLYKLQMNVLGLQLLEFENVEERDIYSPNELLLCAIHLNNIACSLGLDPIKCMTDKWAKKGFNISI